MTNVLQNKKIVILGLGANNKQLAQFLAARGLSFDVIENWRHPEDLLGKLGKYDLIFRTPGLPFLSAPIQEAQKAGAEISSQTKLFMQLCPCPIVGVTGTKGKGTTSSLLYAIVKKSGRRVWLAGNIGRDPFEFFDQIQPDDLVILELSSFQLQGLNVSPHIAVVLSITPDHLNHHVDFDEYMTAKSSILTFQGPDDVAVLHPHLPEEFRQIGAAQKIIFDPASARGFKTKLLGTHNLDNIAAATAAARVLAIDEDTIKAAVAEFDALPHRLNVLGTVNGITYIDDAYSTNVEPVVAAVNSMNQPFVLIVGGHDKGVDMTPINPAVVGNSKLRGVVVIGQMTEKILAAIHGFTGKILTGAKNMDEIILQAQSLVGQGDAILFSPGTSSFDMFKNETDRAEQFVSAVSKLKVTVSHAH